MTASLTPRALRIFDAAELVPAAWAAVSPTGSRQRFRVFNPTITRIAGGYAMAYRVVDEGDSQRRIATCVLRGDFTVETASVTALSDLIEFAAREELDERAVLWHADPRYAVLNGRIYLTWNDGGNKPLNHQFMLLMNERGTHPAGLARELTKDFGRAKTEKNWMLFEHQGASYAVYGICPHEVLHVDLSDPRRVVCRDAHRAKWDSTYSSVYGVLRGSAAPVSYDDGFLSIAHSSFKVKNGRVYRPCFYRFESKPPFAVTHAPSVPLELPNPYGQQFSLPRLNSDVIEVTYPSGFVWDGDTAVVSYGINDELCAIASVSSTEIVATLEPVTPTSVQSLDGRLSEGPPPAARPLRERSSVVPLFWWDAKGKAMDGGLGKRLFATGNFGDIASKEIIERITRMRIRQPRSQERKLLSIGSILHLAGDGDVVWGTGSKGNKTKLSKEVKTLSVNAVRGPLTLDVLREEGIDFSSVKELFDPGCLIPLLYRAEIGALANAPVARKRYRVIPHYKDDLMLRRSDYKHLDAFVSVDASPSDLIAAIGTADLVISSSLHGLIFAEAMGVPACWLSPAGNEDDRKYYDYYFGTGRWAVKRFESIDAALRAEPMPLPKFRFDDYLATFPHEQVAELALPGLKLGERIRTADLDAEEMEDCFDIWNLKKIGKGGMWATANRARIQAYATECSEAADLQVDLTLRPFNPPQYKQPQRIEVQLNRTTKGSIEWARGADDPVKVSLRIPHDGSKRCLLDIVIDARTARSPRSLGFSTIDDRLAVCIDGIAIRVPPAVVPR